MAGFKDSEIIRILRGEKNIGGKGVYKSPEDVVMEATSGVASKAVNQKMTTGKVQKPGKDVEEYVSNGMRLIHSESMRDKVLGLLQSAKNGANGVAEAASNVLISLDRSAGGTIPDEVKLQGAAPLIEQVIEVGETAGIFEFNEDQLKEASAKTVSLYMKRAMDAGTLTIDKMKSAYEGFKTQAESEQKGNQVGDKSVLEGGV